MSQYAKEIKSILASLNEQGDEDTTPLPEEEDLDTIHVYPVEGGGLLLTRTPLDEEDEAVTPPVIESQPVLRVAPRAPSLFVLFLLLLGLLLGLDMADSQLVAMLTPTVTIAITPEVHSLTLHNSASVGKLLSPITLSESQTVPATGHGHRDARAATGTLTFYNGLATPQPVAAGTILTGQDWVSVATDTFITIPPANPPALGAASVAAHAAQMGPAGNIPADDVNTTLASGVYVKNLTAFTSGQDAREFLVVTQADRDHDAASLQARVTASTSATLQQQLLPGQILHRLPCTLNVSADHLVGAEATTLTVTISETCTAVAYDAQQVQDTAARLFVTQATRAFGVGYTLVSPVQVSITGTITSPGNPQVTLAFSGTGTVAYLLTAQTQQHLRAILAGKPRLVALRWLSQQAGIHRASISGISDDQPLPVDPTLLHLLIVVPL